MVGQIGSLVRIPQGLVDLIGSVVLLGISELAGQQGPLQSLQNGDRWLQVQLLGEVDRSAGRFQRGVSSYPGLDDPVHFTTTEDLLAVFPDPDEEHIRLGHLSASDGITVCLNLDALVLRHSAIVGATGSGKNKRSSFCTTECGPRRLESCQYCCHRPAWRVRTGSRGIRFNPRSPGVGKPGS